jgi:hypothetical protein
MITVLDWSALGSFEPGTDLREQKRMGLPFGSRPILASRIE